MKTYNIQMFFRFQVPNVDPFSALHCTQRTLLGFQVDAAQRRRRLLASREDGQSGGSHEGPREMKNRWEWCDVVVGELWCISVVRIAVRGVLSPRHHIFGENKYCKDFKKK